MPDTQALWATLAEAADPKAVAAIKREVQSGPDASLNRNNALAFAAAGGLDEDATIGSFVRASAPVRGLGVELRRGGDYPLGANDANEIITILGKRTDRELSYFLECEAN